MFLAGDLPSLTASQGRDGGWAYRGGGSWTEPTAYALLALAAAGHRGPEWARGREWLRRAQRPDGGWPPHLAVAHSTWVTALAVLVLADQPEAAACSRGLQWLLQQSGRESSWAHRVREWLLGRRSAVSLRHDGWPWFPGAAAWVTPTALTILALEKAARGRPSPAPRQRIESGRQFLLDRMCRDGGWNHGATRALGYEAGSYPETTGVALLALRGTPPARLARSLALAEQAFARSRSAEAAAWLRLGLLAHGRAVPPLPAGLPCRTVLDAALCLLADAGIRVFVG